MIVNNVYGWILEQHLYDSRNQLIASSKTSQHRYYPADGVSLPHKVEIQLPPAQLAFTLDVGEYRINQLSTPPEQLFAMPQFESAQLVNVADPNFVPPGASRNQPATWAQEPRTSGVPNVRGLR
jgi:hypothetical protein